MNLNDKRSYLERNALAAWGVGVAEEIVDIFSVDLEEARHRARLQAVRNVGVEINEHVVQEPENH